MSEMKKGIEVDDSVKDEEVKKVGEELFINKINNIFDEIAREN
jgi:hypothetical protein